MVLWMQSTASDSGQFKHLLKDQGHLISQNEREKWSTRYHEGKELDHFLSPGQQEHAPEGGYNHFPFLWESEFWERESDWLSLGHVLTPWPGEGGASWLTEPPRLHAGSVGSFYKAELSLPEVTGMDAGLVVGSRCYWPSAGEGPSLMTRALWVVRAGDQFFLYTPSFQTRLWERGIDWVRGGEHPSV